jgi:DNA processing protein
MNQLKEKIDELSFMKKYPDDIFYNGDIKLLKKKKISIIGTRRPSKYSREIIHTLSYKLASNDICIVSGGAMGIDAIAHKSAQNNTIAVLPCGINIKYPAVNKNLLSKIEKDALLLSQFKPDFKATPWSFVVRNELVVALGDILIVGEADLGSGSMRSVEFAQKMGKKIYVIPQRLGESNATNELLKEKKAEAIYDIDEFITNLLPNQKLKTMDEKDDFLIFCKTNPTYEEALQKFPEKVFEYELNGKIDIQNGQVFIN